MSAQPNEPEDIFDAITKEETSAKSRAAARWGRKQSDGQDKPDKPKKDKKPKPRKVAGKGDLGYDENGVELEKAPMFVLYKGRKSKPEKIARAIRALTMVLKVGESETRALEIVGEQFSKYEIGKAFTHAAKRMRENGASFKQALMAEEVLPRTVRELVEASQTSQAMQKNLRVAATLIGESQNVKKKLLMNLIQPGFMLALCIVLLFVAVTVIIPNLISSFSMLGTKTPAMTLMVLQAAEITKWVLGAGFVLGFLFAGYWVTMGRKSQKFRVLMDTIALRVWAVGPIVQLSATSRLFQLLSANLTTGIGEPDALRSAANGCGNEAVKYHCVRHAERMIEEGLPLKGFVESSLIPGDARNMLSSAPSVRQEIEIMNELAPEYRAEANVQLETLSKTLDPLVNYLVYGIAGILIIAIVLPMYSMYPDLMNITGSH